MPKCMPKRPCGKSYILCFFGPVQSKFPVTAVGHSIAGSSPAVCRQPSAYRQWFGFCPQGKQNEHSCAAAVKAILLSGGSRMQALPAYGYRAVSSWVRSLGFPP